MGQPYYTFYNSDLIFLIISIISCHVASPARSDRASLLSFASGVTADPTGAIASWRSPSPDGCDWAGITCDEKINRVVELNLSHKSLHGTISPAIFHLSKLEILDLSGNFFSGRIPSEIGLAIALKELSLSSNYLTGTIPTEMGSLRELVYLNLGSNKLSGEIPTSILCNGTSVLQYFDLSNNSLVGKIPVDDQCEAKELQYILLWSNRLEGKVPPVLSNFTKLEWLDLETNFLTGELPSEIFRAMPHLTFLYLSNNRFSGHNGNDLGGELPEIVGDLSSLVQINLDRNLIHGSIPQQISNLVNLTLLNLSSNRLHGSIPSELSRMSSLERLLISNNSLSGQIPSSFGNMSRLGLLDLSRNRLSGTIPDSFANLVQLRRLLLYDNHLSGNIPPSLGQCVNLEILDLSDNGISGEIPGEVAGLTSLKLYLNLSRNLLTGNVPLELSKMDMVLAIDLSSNNLSGGLPPQLGSCIALEHLNLSNNALEGQFPAAIGSLPYLKEIDVSFNRLSGKLPATLQESTTLKTMNFSYNKFSGNVTNKGAFSSVAASSFLGNERLCGSIEAMRKCRAKHARRFLIEILLSLLAIPMLCILGCLLMLRSKVACRIPVLRRNDDYVGYEDEAMSEEVKYPRISRRQLVEATEGFSSSSLVGSGRFGHVYKGVLKDKTAIAVKVLDCVPSGGETSISISESFKRECQILKRTRHRNLIKIITTCSRPDFKALVLPLMSNGSLDDHLYPIDDPKHRLDLIQLVGICSDVAEGMAYLHHHAPVRVVHCDLKPSNILLNEKMTALVTDFGIARLVGGSDESSSSTNESSSYTSTDALLCGSVGYIAPEYGLGKHASPKGDVYSFGVLLLEIVTGKRPTDQLFRAGSSLPEWMKRQYPDRLGPIVEEAMTRYAIRTIDTFDRKMSTDIILELVEIGLICTQHSPVARPTMLNVAHEIGLLKQYLCSPANVVFPEEQLSTN
ncbi:putative leucine-rich repeat receptor-like serine/threonine-protein kinase At2g24130 isoform X2 [Andrographis paniculata]|uniref:putative leucine-rich repeat receptor-like serine/threonine-protein kinase At2g24130 isoform X2 n=1 Tax=Andrographis paniculata TaxID=175694 RepID=UPI0021E93D04|nr:putative leucine-rich repeat receptor-like serine/threonine-protein kinase At2g24130 isoform X2 [Andrographis paniculata]